MLTRIAPIRAVAYWSTTPSKRLLLPVIVTRWFYRHMGVALGIYWAAMGAGPMIFAPLFRWLIETYGWEWSFTLIGIVVGGVLISFSTLIRNSPYEMGLSACGGGGAAKEPPASVATGILPTGLREVLSKRPAWLLMGIHHLGCVGHAIILAHIVSMATFK